MFSRVENHFTISRAQRINDAIFPYSKGLYSFELSSKRLARVGIATQVFQRTDDPLIGVPVKFFHIFQPPKNADTVDHRRDPH